MGKQQARKLLIRRKNQGTVKKKEEKRDHFSL